MTTDTKTVEHMTDAELAALTSHHLLALRQQVVEVQTRVDAEWSPPSPRRPAP